MPGRILHVAAMTHRGQTREHNEDRIAIGRAILGTAISSPSFHVLDTRSTVLCMVADGLGGHAAGEVASERVCRRLIDLTSESPCDPERLRQAILSVHRELYEMMAEDARLDGMGATIAGVAFGPQACVCFNVGDSRVYRIEGRSLIQISTDDVPQTGRTGSVTQCLGGTRTYLDIAPHFVSETTAAGTGYVICSDGLPDAVSLGGMEAKLTDDPETTVAALFGAAMESGARDDVSIVCARAM
jgi:PPM family protein phosphatase